MIGLIKPGEPGDAWFNDLGVAMQQLECSLINTCGSCFQWHLQIAEAWFTPLHRCCRCQVRFVIPGEYARPWANYFELLKAMDASQHESAVGKYNWRIINEGVVKWSDVVTSGRVRTFEQVIAREKLTVAELIKAGIPRGVAESEWNRVHTPAHEAFQKKVDEAATGMRAAGMTDDQIKTEFARQIAPRIMGRIPSGKTPEIKRKPRVATNQPTLPGLGLTPQEQIAAAQVVLDKIRTESGQIRTMPDFNGSQKALEDWVRKTYPETAVRLTNDDWIVLLLVIDAQKRLKKMFADLGIDERKGFEAMGGQ